ncbi:terribly reduced optic lobes isoform X3 [Anticarsia gemmatalis]|uniref:terribly reduced optic lobes isoform X3 n=1 Tax=Anticarsia gemmatalis TaxID=129554 RepID=UPI003F776B18
MRTRGVPLAALLPVLAITFIQVCTASDLYWEGEEGASNEFLEVKNEDPGITHHLNRFKRDFWSNLFGNKDDADPPGDPNNDADDGVTDNVDNADVGDTRKDDDSDNFGSGSSDRVEPEPREKTLRVTFTVLEPYHKEFSDRDSPKFLNFSKQLANAVDQIFLDLPGVQKSSLIRIQSIEEFTSKVTLEIVTTNYDDTDTIRDRLRNYIRRYQRLGGFTANDNDFSAQVVDPATVTDPTQPRPYQPGDYHPEEPSPEYSTQAYPDQNQDVTNPVDQNGGDPNNPDLNPPSDLNNYNPDPFGQDPNNPNNYDQDSNNNWNTNQDPNNPTNSGQDPNNRDASDPNNYDPDQNNQNNYNQDPSNWNTNDQRPDNFTDYNPDSGSPDNYDQDQDKWYTGNQDPNNPSNYNPDPNNYNQDPNDPNNYNPDPNNYNQDPNDPNNYNPDPNNYNPDPNDPNNYNQDPNNPNNNYSPDPFAPSPNGPTGQDTNDVDPNSRDNGSSQDPNQGNGQDPNNPNNYNQDPNNPPRGDQDNNNGNDGDNNDLFGNNQDPFGQNPDGQGNSGQPDNQGNNGQDQNNGDDFGPPPIGPNPDDRDNRIDSDSNRLDSDAGPILNVPDDKQQNVNNGNHWPLPDPGRDDVTTRRNFNPDCPSGFLRCDETRCVEPNRRCDGQPDCYDGADEQGCPEKQCGSDDFRCNNGKCIESYRQCNGVIDCLDKEDELNCPCRNDEFRCESDGSCIEARKQCDGTENCNDGSDERNCANAGSFRCRTGKIIPEHLRCNRQYDCPPGDFSDEKNCPCGESDFKCDNGHCIPASRHCDRTHDCQDGSDERNCNYGTDCMAYEYKCKSGMCVQADARCNNTVECDDETDEEGCSCKRDQYHCRDGSCINIAYLCNGRHDCSNGEDEYNCRSGSCRKDETRCNDDSGCGKTCDGELDCPGGEDEENCDACAIQCDGKCLPADKVCDAYQDCSDGADEYACNECNRAEDFRCDNGDCISFNLKCNNYEDCVDGSDERDCNSTMTPNIHSCSPDEFQCLSNDQCISMRFHCDGHADCLDSSDETNCPCPPDSWQCRDGQCIRSAGYCNGFADCDDGTDESDCPYLTTRRPRPFVPATELIQPSTANPLDGRGGCRPHQWRCENGPCINAYLRCNGHIDCPYDLSDEFDCPPNSPLALNLQTEPSKQSVRDGGDVVFQCRDVGPHRAAVKWRRAGGPLKSGSTDIRGRLEMFNVTQADAGEYVCEAVQYAGLSDDARKSVFLVVNPAPPLVNPYHQCQPHEATCNNGQECIPVSAVCNGRIDCSDGSDEESCHHDGICEPNQFKCKNRKCVLKTWICDSEDDCGDGSDEENCNQRGDGRCSATEFTCTSRDQCVPRSFHCDGLPDCQDHSDEVGCRAVYVHSPPKPSFVTLNAGETLILRCEAVGIPVPVISWRLNWGHVPPQCTWTSENGSGVLTCPDMQHDHSGAYSCEGLNNKGTAFATPDAIVFVNKTDICPRGYFNSEARSESECISCFCFGKSSQCHSADLFTYNIPTPLGKGGTRLVGIETSPAGDVNIATQPVDQYHYMSIRNEATVTKFGDSSLRSRVQPYLTLPDSYLGNQLKSYGGHIKYTLTPHTAVFGIDDSAPSIIIKGKYGNLFHNVRASGARSINVEARFTPEHWSRYPDGSSPATREDIMVALTDVTMIVLRASLNNAGVNISSFEMQSADHTNVGLGAASLVEECTCPKGYEGLSCQKCASGFVRKRVGPYIGDCEPEECPPGTYGNPAAGIPCDPCPCPLTNRENQFARTCSLGPDGRVICDCFPGYEGQNCEVCAPGYEGNPSIPGNSCQPKKSNNCNPVGTKSVRGLDECVCKDNVQGRYCDQCKNDSFFLSNDFRTGCAVCFCSGMSQQCTSSNFRRRTIGVQFNVPQIVDQVKVYNSAPASAVGSVRYASPVETSLRPELYRGEVTVNNVERSSSSNVYYWSMPLSFSGDKVTAYGGYLNYVLKNVPSSVDPRYRNTAADVQLISDNHLTFHYFGDFSASHDGILNASVQLLEKGWQRHDGKEVFRQHFLLALADVKTILIKATYSPGPQLASPVSASIDIAEPEAYGPSAFHVEQCVCPPGYIGTSCEDCAPGYTRSSSGLYLEHCEPCECNGKSTKCNPETGVCYDCADNTDGDQCDQCKLGYERDQYGNCVDRRSPADCNCDPRGITEPCDGSGTCYCKQNVEGNSCDRCKPGTFGLDAGNPDGCLACYCSGVTTDCHEGNQYTRVPLAAPVLGDNYGGFTITDLHARRPIKDSFVPFYQQSELAYNFQDRPDTDYYWSLPLLPGNRVLSYGGILSLRQKFSSNPEQKSERGTDVVLDGGDVSIYWTNPNQYSSGESYTYQVPLSETGWYLLNSNTPATHSNFMNVLKNLKRVLVRATVAQNIYATTIADVYMESAIKTSDPRQAIAKGIEVCMCPPGYMGTSCETCQSGYYKDSLGYCHECSCNGHDCQLNSQGQVVCNCQPPYTGFDCSTIGGDPLVTEPPTRPPPVESSVTVTILSPVIQIKDIGGSVNFTCQAQSRNTRRPLPVRWIKSQGLLPLERSQVDPYYGTLLISNLRVSDSGIYVCETSDGITTAQATATLKVPGNDMRSPSVEISPIVKEYFEGDRVELDCRVEGNPLPDIAWQRRSRRPLPLYSEMRDGLFIIENARVEDSGEYMCTATNNVGTDSRTAMITIMPRPSRPPREKLTVSNNAPTVEEGQNIRIVCTGTTNVPAGSIDWVRQDSARFQPNVRSDNGVLYIEAAIPENQGVYICHSQQYDIAPIQIHLTISAINPVQEEYNLTLSVSRLSIPTGGSGAVDCMVRGRLTPTIRWTKAEGVMGADSGQRGNSLVINNAQDSDRGYYLCEAAVNGIPVAQNYVFVEIERREAPRVEIWPQGEQRVPLGGEHELHCRVLAGTPVPDITWNRNGRELSPHTQLLSNNVLKFYKIEVNDEGEYTCTAHNAAGTVSASAVIKVRSPPEITISPDGNIQARYGEPVNVECRATGHPEPLVSISNGDTQLVSPQRSHASLYIPSASDRDEGYYTCTASSDAGTITEQFVINVDRGDGGYGIDDNGGSGDPDDPYNPADYDYPRDLHIAEGEREFIINCTDSGERVTWTRDDNQPLSYNQYQNGTRLIIRDVSKGDSGVYICNIFNNNEIQQSVYWSVVVGTAPTIQLKPPTQTVQPGESPTVECIVTGDNIQSVTWRPYNRDASSRVEIRGSILKFHQIEVEDAGKYECIAVSEYASRSARAEVIVNEDSDRTWVSHDNEQWARAGAAVRLSCNASQPNTRIVWTKDGRPLPRSITREADGSLFIRLAHKSDTGRYICNIRDVYGRTITSNYIDLHIQGARDPQPQQMVSIDKPTHAFRVGDNVQVLCRVRSRDANPQRVDVKWVKQGTNEYVDYRSYGGGAMLVISSVASGDAGVYRCIVNDGQGRIYADDFELQVDNGNPNYPEVPTDGVAEYTAPLHSSVDLPCRHNLELPVEIEWRKEYTPLPADVRTNQPNLHLESVTEADAGMYVCRVSNIRRNVEARAILRVSGVVPRFDGNSYIGLKPLKDAYQQFEIEISFKPSDANGLILYNSQNQGREGDYIALQLKNGVPEFIMNTGSDTVTRFTSDRPLALNEWHTIRLNRSKYRVTMDVDNRGPFFSETYGTVTSVLDLLQPLYIGGVPDYNQLPADLAGASGFIGCVSMLILGGKPLGSGLMLNSEQYRISECNTCSPNVCHNNGFCQEAHNERGFMCYCAPGFAGLTCDVTGDGCRPGLCGPGKCSDTDTGYKCACPVTHHGNNCEIKQSIEYPAFTGSAFLAIKAPQGGRTLRMSMKVKAASPVTDGIIMYCAESQRGYGGFTSLTVHDGRLEFRYDLGRDSQPIVLVSDRPLPAGEWTNVHVARIGSLVSLKINSVNVFEMQLPPPYNQMDLTLDTPIFVGGVDESVTLNNNTGVTGGFNGCIKEFNVHGKAVDIVNENIQSANVLECPPSRGDIPVGENFLCQCRNGGRCISETEPTTCACPAGFYGPTCEYRTQYTPRDARPSDPCLVANCLNGGTCRPDSSSRMNVSCDCPLGWAGATCQMELTLTTRVGFGGNGYLELPRSMLSFDNLESDPAQIALAIHTLSNGVLVFQNEVQRHAGYRYGDYLLLKIERGVVVLEWDVGGGRQELSVPEIRVIDGERHKIVVEFSVDNFVSLTVDDRTEQTTATGIASVMNVDSNIYIGGIPDSLNQDAYPGFSGCFEQIEFMNSMRGVDFGTYAVAGRNTQRCKDY